MLSAPPHSTTHHKQKKKINTNQLTSDGALSARLGSSQRHGVRKRLAPLKSLSRRPRQVNPTGSDRKRRASQNTAGVNGGRDRSSSAGDTVCAGMMVLMVQFSCCSPPPWTVGHNACGNAHRTVPPTLPHSHLHSLPPACSGRQRWSSTWRWRWLPSWSPSTEPCSPPFGSKTLGVRDGVLMFLFCVASLWMLMSSLLARQASSYGDNYLRLSQPLLLSRSATPPPF